MSPAILWTSDKANMTSIVKLSLSLSDFLDQSRMSENACFSSFN